MDPRGILPAASGAKVPFPLNIPDAGKQSAADQSGRFAGELDREMQRQQRSPENSKADGMQIREKERTKESNLDKPKGPESAWEDESRKPIDQEGKISTGPQTRENKAPRKATLYDNAKQAELAGELRPALEEWVVNYLKAMLNQGVDSSGPGGRAGLSEGELGPRFAIPAPYAITLMPGDLGVARTPNTVEAKVPPTESSFAAEGLYGDALKAGNSAAEKNIQSATAMDSSPPQLLTAAKGGAGIEDISLSQEISNLRGDGNTNEPPVNIEVTSNGEAIRHLTELIGKALEAANNALKDIAQKVPEGLSGDKELILQAMMNSESGGVEPKGIFKQAKPADIPSAPDKGPSVMNPGPEGMQNTLTKNEQLNFKDVTNPQPFKPDDAAITAEVERITRDFGQDMVASVRLRLHPPELGNLVVEFKRDEHGLRIEFHTPNQAVFKALEDAGPKMMERLEKAGVDVGSLDVFLNNNGGAGHSIVSPLDNPDNSPDSMAVEGEMDIAAGQAEAVSMRYLAYDSSIIDLVI